MGAKTDFHFPWKWVSMSTTRSNNWSLTINNPTDADHEDMARARQKGWKVMGQVEKGENGTPHLQLHLQTPQIRFSAVKKAFPRAHIEVARNVQALANYVAKEDTRLAALPQQQEMYPSLSKFWHLVFQFIESQNWIHWDGDKWWDEAFHDLNVPLHYDEYLDYPKRFADHNARVALLAFERAVDDLIWKGFHIEHFYSPPNISIFKKFHFSVLQRARVELNAQTRRQTDMNENGFTDNEESDVHTSDVSSHQEESVQEVNVPTYPQISPPCSSPPPSSPEN